jgi:ABC-2 type transporter
MLYSILIISINIILSTVNVLFRDLQNIWDIVLTYGVFLTPIIYTIAIPKAYLKIYYFVNPLAYPIEEMKASFFGVSGVWQSPAHLLSFILSVIFWVLIALIVRKRLGLKVADYL